MKNFITKVKTHADHNQILADQTMKPARFGFLLIWVAVFSVFSSFSQNQTCFVSSANPPNPNVTATVTWTFTATTVTIRTTLAKTFVDNTYGTNIIGWPGPHKFNDLVGSDKLQLALYDATNVKQLEFKIDYISASSSVPSGYKTLGVTGGDGGMIFGSASNIVSCMTSLDKNFNSYGYVLTSNSPATDLNYTPNPTYPNWIFDVWYEVTVNLSAFGAPGFGSVAITNIHASPSKTGNNTEPVEPGPCPILAATAVAADVTCGTTCTGSIDLTITNGTPPYSVLWSNGATTQDLTALCPGTYTVTVSDAASPPATATATAVVDPAPSVCSGEFCFSSSANPPKPEVSAKVTWTLNPDNTVTIRTTLAKTFVDNTYGTNIIGWPGAHKFNDLVGSDKVQLALYDANNVKKLEFKIDYITASSSAPSGYKTLGVTGGDGGMIVGSASDIVSCMTSLDKNFNTFGYVLTSNSPATDNNYTPNPTYPNWIFDVWYEVKVNLSAFGAAGFGSVDITNIHASPSKTGSNSEPVDPGPCPVLTAVAVATDVACGTTCTGSINLTITNGTPPYSVLWSNGATTEDLTALCPGTYTVTVTDAATPPATATATATVDPAPAVCSGNICFGSCTNNPNVWANILWTLNADNTITLRTVFAKTFVDNTYGTNAIGWPNGHTFNNLVGSDKLQLALYDANNVKVLEFKIDYITASSSAPSGYKTLGVTGGDGGMIVGSANYIVSCMTSLDKNFNDYGYVLTSNSPATNNLYAPNPTYPNWIYDVWYEVKVDLAAFGAAGYGHPAIALVHASPSKTGNNSECVEPVPCPAATLGDRVVLDGVCPPEFNPIFCPGFGIQDAGEPGVPDVLVSLYTCADVFVSSMHTDANGYYLFTNLAPGSYYVIFSELPDNRSFSAQDQGSDDSKDSDANPLGKTACVTLAAGDINLTVDAIIYNSKTCPQFEVVCPPDITLPCNGVIPDPDPTSVTWDPDPDCIYDPVVVTFVSDVPAWNGCIETITRTYKAEDASGKIAYCSHTIMRKVDNDPPLISGVGGPQTISCTETPVFSEPTAFDNCDGALIVPLPYTDAIVPGACDAVYTITRTWTATDLCGKSSTASQTITVVDNSCPPASTVPPVVDGLLDPSYQFFKNVSLGTLGDQQYSRGTMYKFEDATSLYLAYVESRAVNDNVYGPLPSDVIYAGWGFPYYHVWDHLVGSDRVRIQLLNSGGTMVFDVEFDYLFPQWLGGVLIGYNSGTLAELPLGANAGAFYDGSPATALGYNNVVTSQTSEDKNQSCVSQSVFETNSPGPPESSYPCWEYRYIYEVKISKAGLGLNDPFNDPSKLLVPEVHNSPNKDATGIKGFKYCDANNNGAWDPGEAGLGGWQINLAGPTNHSPLQTPTVIMSSIMLQSALTRSRKLHNPGMSRHKARHHLVL